MGARFEGGDWSDGRIHRHEAAAANAAALVDLNGVLLDCDVMLQLGSHLDQARHGQFGLAERLLQLADRIVQFLHLAQQSAIPATQLTILQHVGYWGSR